MSRLPTPLSIMYFPFLLSIQLAVYSIAKPIEDSSSKDFGAFPALSNLISEFSHGWTQTTPDFYRLDSSQSQIISQPQPNSRPLWASLNEVGDGPETAFTSAEGSLCRPGQEGIHRRDGTFCTLDRKTEGAKNGAQGAQEEGAQKGVPEAEGAVAQGARGEEGGAQKDGSAPTDEENPTIAPPVWAPPDIYDPNWHKELDESIESMKIERERNNNLPWDDSTRCGDKWSFIPTTYSLHVCCDGVAMGAGLYLEVNNCDWRTFFNINPPPPKTFHFSFFVLISKIYLTKVYPLRKCAKKYDLCCEMFLVSTDEREKDMDTPFPPPPRVNTLYIFERYVQG